MEQGSLKIHVKAEEVSDSAVSRCKDLRAAIRLCIETSGLQIKEVAFDLNINKDHLSRMINSSDDPRHFPPERLNDLMDICGNEIPLRWMSLSRNYGLYRLKSALEIENEALKAQLAEQRREQEIMIKLLKEIRP